MVGVDAPAMGVFLLLFFNSLRVFGDTLVELKTIKREVPPYFYLYKTYLN
jgi:hypothetical protein